VSDSAIDAMYEAELKAAARYLEVRVEFSGGKTETVRKFLDTPEGRVHAGKVADEWFELDKVERVEIVPIRRHGYPGAPVEAGERSPRHARKATTVPAANRVPASSRACCEPRLFPSPTGRMNKRHRFNCPSFPGQPYADVTAMIHDISQARLSRRHAMESRRTGLDDAIADHPASYVSAETHALVHPGEDAEDCIECSERSD
jgi:hypothetical protein